MRLLGGVSHVLNTLHVSGLVLGANAADSVPSKESSVSSSHLIHCGKTRWGSGAAVALGAPSTSSVEDASNF